MWNLRHHAAKRRRVRPHHHTIHRLQPERPDDGLVFLRAANGAAYQLDFDRCFSHIVSRFWFLVSRFWFLVGDTGTRNQKLENLKRLTSPYPEPIPASPLLGPCRAAAPAR